MDVADDSPMYLILSTLVNTLRTVGSQLKIILLSTIYCLAPPVRCTRALGAASVLSHCMKYSTVMLCITTQTHGSVIVPQSGHSCEADRGAGSDLNLIGTSSACEMRADAE